MKPSQKIALGVAAVAILSTIVVVMNLGAPAAPPPVAGPREPDAATLALVAPLVKGGSLLNYTVTELTIVPGRGLVVSLMKPGGFYPDGGESDGGPGCDPSQVVQALLALDLALVPDAGSPGALVKGPYAIYSRPQNVPQFEADRLAGAFAELISGKVDGPVPAALSGGPQLH